MAVGDRLQTPTLSGVAYSDMEVTDETAANGVRQMARLVKVVDDNGATVNPASSSAETSTVYSGSTALTPKFAVIDAASSGDNTLVAAVTAKKIRVLACYMVAAGAVNVRFESGAGGAALSGQMNLAANGGFVLPFNPVGWFETAINTLLNLELSGAVSVDGTLVYVEV